MSKNGRTFLDTSEVLTSAPLLLHCYPPYDVLARKLHVTRMFLHGRATPVPVPSPRSQQSLQQKDQRRGTFRVAELSCIYSKRHERCKSGDGDCHFLGRTATMLAGRWLREFGRVMFWIVLPGHIPDPLRQSKKCDKGRHLCVSTRGRQMGPVRTSSSDKSVVPVRVPVRQLSVPLPSQTNITCAPSPAPTEPCGSVPAPQSPAEVASAEEVPKPMMRITVEGRNA